MEGEYKERTRKEKEKRKRLYGLCFGKKKKKRRYSLGL